MMFSESMAIILLSAAVFLTLVLYLASDINNLEKWTSASFTVAILGGLGIYGTINAANVGLGPIAVLRTVMDMGRMFGGSDRFADFVDLVGENIWLGLLFWIIHFCAYYALVSAVIIVIGKGALLKLRTWLLLVKDVELIYGVDENTIAFGKRLTEEKNTAVVFVGRDENYEMAVRQMGAVLYTDVSALQVLGDFYKRLGLKRRNSTVRVNAISADPDDNLSYALSFLKLLEEKKVDPKRTGLVILGKDEDEGASLQTTDSHYGYGSVKAFDQVELAARLLMRTYPPCDVIEFDENAKAKDDMECVLVGFGSCGQEVLKKLVERGQFEGSHFHVQVYDPAVHSLDGLFRIQYRAMLEEYDIDFSDEDARSCVFAEYIREKAGVLKYIVIATGSEKEGREVAHDIKELLNKFGSSIPVYQCCRDKIIAYDADGNITKTGIYDADILYHGRLDDLAMRINRYYHGNDKTAEEYWADCDYFSRMSSRASADHLSSFLGHIGLEKTGEPGSRSMENLAKSEHLRWCAFHYSMGYSPMDRETWNERAARFERGEDIKISKDAENKLHACLIPWDALDELSDSENAVTGKNLDYKQMDRDNVVVVKGLLEEEDKASSDEMKKKNVVWIPVVAVSVLLIAGLGVFIYAGHFGKKQNHMMGYIPAPDAEYVSVADDDISYSEARSSLGDAAAVRFVPSSAEPPATYPLSFDSPYLLSFLEYAYPPNRNQGNYGTCWAHAATGIAEINLISQGYADTSLDLSELQIAYFHFNNGTNTVMGDTGDKVVYTNKTENFLNHGSSSDLLVTTLANRRGFTYEQTVPYSAADYVLKNGLTSQYADSNCTYLRNAIKIKPGKNSKQLKQAIFLNGAATVGIYYDEKYYNKKTNAFNAAGEFTTNHEVIIVGWDDSFPAGYFKDKPSKDGAWLIRNSWSTKPELDIGSYFWVSYEDTSLLSSVAITYEMEVTPSENENLYTYSTQTTVPDYRISATGYGGNIFKANGSGKTEMLTQVAFFAGNVGSRGSDYKISIQYFKDGEPDGKIVSTVEGKIYFDGFYTVDLEDPVKLNKGDYFFVSVELDNAKIGTEQDYDIYGFEVTSDSQKGQSYMHVGNDFLDFHDFTRDCGYGDRFDNLMINAITVEK